MSRPSRSLRRGKCDAIPEGQEPRVADRQLDLAAASAPTVLGDLNKALTGAYLQVLMLDPEPFA